MWVKWIMVKEMNETEYRLKGLNDTDCRLKEMNEVDYGLREMRWNINREVDNVHCVKSVQIRSFFRSILSRIWSRKTSVFWHFSRSGYDGM